MGTVITLTAGLGGIFEPQRSLRSLLSILVLKPFILLGVVRLERKGHVVVNRNGAREPDSCGTEVLANGIDQGVHDEAFFGVVALGFLYKVMGISWVAFDGSTFISKIESV